MMNKKMELLTEICVVYGPKNILGVPSLAQYAKQLGCKMASEAS